MNAFRTSFAFEKAVNWFPGHMLKASKGIAEKMSACDLIIEVRDARVRICLFKFRSHD